MCTYVTLIFSHSVLQISPHLLQILSLSVASVLQRLHLLSMTSLFQELAISGACFNDTSLTSSNLGCCFGGAGLFVCVCLGRSSTSSNFLLFSLVIRSNCRIRCFLSTCLHAGAEIQVIHPPAGHRFLSSSEAPTHQRWPDCPSCFLQHSISIGALPAFFTPHLNGGAHCFSDSSLVVIDFMNRLRSCSKAVSNASQVINIMLQSSISA